MSEKKLTAAKRIEQLEEQMEKVGALFDKQSAEMEGLRQALVALGKRVNAVISAGESGSINDETISKIQIEERVRELQNNVNMLLDNGAISISKAEALIDNSSFVVGRELDSENNVINPRVQFAVQTLQEEYQSNISGKKLGDVVEGFVDESIKLEITELYTINNVG